MPQDKEEIAKLRKALEVYAHLLNWERVPTMDFHMFNEWGAFGDDPKPVEVPKFSYGKPWLIAQKALEK